MGNPTMPGAGTSASGLLIFRRGDLSARVNLRIVGLSLIALLLIALTSAMAMMLGSLRIPAIDVVRSLFGHGADQQHIVVNTLRLPRVLLALLVGAGLAVAGAIVQGLVRNPLVSPDIVGIDSGANLFVTFWIVSGLSWTFVPAAIAGAAAAAIVISLLSWRGGVAPNRLIVVGIGIRAALSSPTTLLLARGTIEQVRPAQVWSIGSIYGADWADVRLMGLTLAVLLPAAVALTWPMRILQLGEDSARSLGFGVERLRLAMLLVGCALAAVCVALAVPIGFVALMIPTSPGCWPVRSPAPS